MLARVERRCWWVAAHASARAAGSGRELGFARIFPGLVANFLSRFCTASRQISHLFLEKFISVLHSLEANISFISREIYLGFAQPRGKYLIYFSINFRFPLTFAGLWVHMAMTD